MNEANFLQTDKRALCHVFSNLLLFKPQWSLVNSISYSSNSSVVGWLVGFGFNGPFRQYFSLYRAVSQREGERGERIDKSKNVQTTPTCTYCKRNRPLPYCNQNCRTPRHWKFTEHHRSTRPPPNSSVIWIIKLFAILSTIVTAAKKIVPSAMFRGCIDE